MSTLQENQSLNTEYERNKKEREMKEEIERLNNILNEFDKWLEERIKDVPETMSEVYEDEKVLKYLRELKGEDKR